MNINTIELNRCHRWLTLLPTILYFIIQVDLLDLEVGALLRRQDLAGDGPSDVSLQVREGFGSNLSVTESCKNSKWYSRCVTYVIEKDRYTYRWYSFVIIWLALDQFVEKLE
jgi:hypothetical protein